MSIDPIWLEAIWASFGIRSSEDRKDPIIRSFGLSPIQFSKTDEPLAGTRAEEPSGVLQGSQPFCAPVVDSEESSRPTSDLLRRWVADSTRGRPGVKKFSFRDCAIAVEIA